MKMNTNKVISNIEVEIGYTTYSFDDVHQADLFCRWAAKTIDNEYNHNDISMKVDYIVKVGESDE